MHANSGVWQSTGKEQNEPQQPQLLLLLEQTFWKGHMIPLWFPCPLGKKGINQSQNIHLIFERNQPQMANACTRMMFVKCCWNIKIATEGSASWWGSSVVWHTWPKMSEPPLYDMRCTNEQEDSCLKKSVSSEKLNWAFVISLHRTKRAQKIQNWSSSWPWNRCTHTFGRHCLIGALISVATISATFSKSALQWCNLLKSPENTGMFTTANSCVKLILQSLHVNEFWWKMKALIGVNKIWI